MTITVEYPLKGTFVPHIVGVMDYPSGDSAQGDISGLITNWFGPASAKTWITVDDFSAIEVGFNLVSRKIINGHQVYPFTIVLGNAAPRAQATKNLEAAPFVTFELTNGVRVFTTLSEYNEEVEFLGEDGIRGPINPLKIPKEGTQFRSSLLPEFAARFYTVAARGDDNLISQVVDLDIDLRSSVFSTSNKDKPIRVLHVDNFGNIKLSVSDDDPRVKVANGERFEIEIGGVRNSVVKGRHLGDVEKLGDICFYPGSSTLTNGERFMELCLVGDSAAHAFSNQHGLRRQGNRARSGQVVTFSF